MPGEAQNTAEARLKQAAAAYPFFLRDARLEDTPLTRLCFFNTVKKEFVDHPIENPEIQAEIIDGLDVWMKKARGEMLAMMPATPRSLYLHTLEKRQGH
jgi:hypothetical protein